MTRRVFIDTNILIYTRDQRCATKRDTARAWLRELAAARLAYVNLQVLNELTRWVLANERDRDLDEVRAEIDELRLWGEKPLDEEETALAWLVRREFGFQWFDCLLIGAAERAGCDVFLTEDMVDRARFNSVLLVNPFRASISDILPKH